MQTENPMVLCRRCSYINLPESRVCVGCGVSFRGYSPISQPSPHRDNKGWWGDINWQAKVAIILGTILAVVIIIVAKNQQPELNNAKVAFTKPALSAPERLNVSEPTFSTSGINFTLNDNRPNKALWVSIKIGSSGSVDENLMGWFSSSGVKPGELSMSFQEFKYMDSGIDVLIQSTQCEVTIGAKLEVSDKIVFTTYKAPFSEIRRVLLKSFKR